MTTKQNGHKDDEQLEGVGPEGTIPNSEDGIAVSSTKEPSNFEPEEDTPEGDTPVENGNGGA
ncbi:hypothetical protein D6T63_18445 [Arthrobacter cheniae]|uniref:Uncharacterized protein n=1 Tax=Arthrobacter cheniae TaxID=1258888 RepID=A0A3A5M785_9MICC|nr:hypothetical protein [Arthrobacter cheniae]RJT74894.1 hypothetical protein D6T63_18445 [Arthrobacter cheniae]